MIKAEYVHEAFRKDQKYPLDLLENREFSALEQYFAQLWESRTEQNKFQWEKDWFNFPYRMFYEMFLNQGPLALRHIEDWSKAYPESIYPYLMKVRYWGFWSAEYRGGTWANQVTEDMWECAREAQKQIYVTAIQALTFSDQCWTVVIHLLNSSARLDEPQWFDKWLTKQKMPQNLRHIIKPSYKELAALSGLHVDLALKLPEQVPSLLLPYIELKKSIHFAQKASAFWTKIFIDHSHFGLVAGIDYCFYLLPRWGHSYDDITQFIQSDWCHHFSEIEKNELNFVMWFDSIEDSYSNDQIGEIKKHIQIAQDLLKRPLSDSNRAKIYLRLAYFYGLLNESDSKILECYLHTVN